MTQNKIVLRSSDSNKKILVKAVITIFVSLLLLSMSFKSELYELFAFASSIIATWNLFSYSWAPFSLHKIVNLFVLVFFVFANAIQYVNHSIVTSLIVSFSNEDYEIFQMVVLLFLLFFNAYYFISNNRVIHESRSKGFAIKYNLMCFIALMSFVLIVYYYRRDLPRLFVRGFEGDAFSTEFGDNSLSLLFEKFVRPIPVMCLILCGINKAPKRIIVFCFILALFSVFPTGLSRNAMVMYWLPVALVFFKPLRKPIVFPAIMIIGIFLVFPLFDNFRYFNGSFSSNMVGFSYLDSMNYDSSQEFMIVIKKDIVTWGNQLLGAILFFVPRSFWPAKPIGSGAYIANTQDVFSNISMPFLGEGYINFGWIGVIAFSFILSWFCTSADRQFWTKKKRGSISINDGYYYLLVGALFFILRGDLMSSFSYTVGTLVSFYFVSTILTKKTSF